MSYLLDTCILSKLRKIKKYPDKKLENWIQKQNESAYFISALSLGEIQLGISKLNLSKSDDKQKKRVLENWLHEELISRFNNRILMVDTDVVFVWGKLLGESQQKGHNFPIVDGLIAATGIVHNLTVVTENTNDFVASEVRLFNPWTD